MVQMGLGFFLGGYLDSSDFDVRWLIRLETPIRSEGAHFQPPRIGNKNAGFFQSRNTLFKAVVTAAAVSSGFGARRPPTH